MEPLGKRVPENNTIVDRKKKKKESRVRDKMRERKKEFFMISLFESWIQLVPPVPSVLHEPMNFLFLFEPVWTSFIYSRVLNKTTRLYLHIWSIPSIQEQQLGPKIYHLFRGTFTKSILAGSRDLLDINCMPDLLHLRIR